MNSVQSPYSNTGSSSLNYVATPIVVHLTDTPHTLLDPSLAPAPTGLERPIKSYPLSDIPDLHIQQALIIKDLLYVLLGHEGYYVRYSEKYSPGSPTSRLLGPDFKIAKHLDVSLKDITKRVARCGKMYVSIYSFLEQYDKAIFGQVNQSLCAQIRGFITTVYHPLVVQLETEFNTRDSSLNLIRVDQVCQEAITVPLSHLYEIVTIIHQENRNRHQKRAGNAHGDLLASIKHDLRDLNSLELLSDTTPSLYITGQATLRIVQECLDANQADETSFRFLTGLFDQVSSSYLHMLNQWLVHGTVNDPYDEFLVKEVDPPANITIRNSDRYWESKFVIRKEQDQAGNDIMMKQFVSKAVQLKILRVGRYLNVIKCCGIDVCSLDGGSTSNIHIGSIYSSNASSFIMGAISSTDFDIRLENAYRRANRLIFKLYSQGYDLLSSLQFMKHFWFLQQQKAVQYDEFCQSSLAELKKPGNMASLSRLTRHFQRYVTGVSEIPDSIQSVLLQLTRLSMTADNYYTHLLDILAIKPTFAEMDYSGHAGDSFRFLLKKSLEFKSHRVDDSMISNSPSGGDSSGADKYAIFNMNVEVTLPFPLNLLFKEDMLASFSLISRNLLIAKFLVHFHGTVWREMNRGVWRYPKLSGPVKKWILRMRVFHSMLQSFLVEYSYYLNHDVMEPEWAQMNRKVIKACVYAENYQETVPSDGFSFNSTSGQDVDFHNTVQEIQSCLNAIMKGSFLVNKELIELLQNILMIILQFDQFALSLSKTIIHLDATLFEKHYGQDGSRSFEPVKNKERVQKMNVYLNRLWESWNDQMGNYLEGLEYLGTSENDCFLKLFHRLKVVQ